MIDNLLSNLAPHHCSGCAKIGTLLCDNCKYDIVSEPFLPCVLCGGLQISGGVCTTCKTYCERAWCTGERHDALRQLVDALKFERTKAAYQVLGDLLIERLPSLPENVVIVPIPTIAPHIRERGYDQTKLIARYVAKQLDRPLGVIIQRKTNSMQRGASKKQREQQARQAFRLTRTPTEESCYLLIDDVVTTGSTLRFAAQTLRDGGATAVWAAVVARQPLD